MTYEANCSRRAADRADKQVFNRAWLLRLLLAALYLGKHAKKLRYHYDLIIETFIGVPLKWADATYAPSCSRSSQGIILISTLS